MGPGRVELPTLRLSGVRSNQLSYEPNLIDYRRMIIDYLPYAAPINKFDPKHAEQIINHRLSIINPLRSDSLHIQLIKSNKKAA
jgi:hypothetical protein